MNAIHLHVILIGTLVSRVVSRSQTQLFARSAKHSLYSHQRTCCILSKRSCNAAMSMSDGPTFVLASSREGPGRRGTPGHRITYRLSDIGWLLLALNVGYTLK